MQKDMKIGMIVGVVLTAGVGVYLCTHIVPGDGSGMVRQNPVIPDPTIEPDTRQFQESSVLEIASGSVDDEPVEQVAVDTSLQAVEVEPLQEPRFYEQADENLYIEQSYEVKRFYIVRRGDTLSRISKLYYGTVNQWRKIHEANRSVIKNPDKLEPGVKLIIPSG